MRGVGASKGSKVHLVDQEGSRSSFRALTSGEATPRVAKKFAVCSIKSEADYLELEIRPLQKHMPPASRPIRGDVSHVPYHSVRMPRAMRS